MKSRFDNKDDKILIFGQKGQENERKIEYPLNT